MDALGGFRRVAGGLGRQGGVSIRPRHPLRRYAQRQVKPTPDSPLQKLGIDKVPPIVTSCGAARRQDPSRRRQAHAARRQLVTAQDIEAMLKAQGLERRGLVAW